MSRDKAPAFQWYPKDYLTDEHVAVMTLTEEGAYRRLLDYCWLHETLPSDIESLARMCRIGSDEMSSMWPSIEPCFRKDGDRWRHPRLDLERRKQQARRKAKSDAGKAGAEARWDKEKNGTAIPVPLANDSSSSPSASATPVEKKRASKKPRAHPIPDDWTPKDSHADKAKAERVDLSREAERFRHHHAAKGSTYVDWDRAFHTWLMRAHDFGHQTPDSTPPPQSAGFYK